MSRKTMHISKRILGFARAMRSEDTKAERLLWTKLRAKRFHNLKFRRQVPIEPFIVDFLCIEKNLIIEVDGDVHFEESAKEKDMNREIFLRSKGFEILRFSNTQVLTSVDSVLSSIRNFVDVDVLPSP